MFDFINYYVFSYTTLASNSTVTPGLRIAGVVISSLGVGATFIISVILFGMCCIFGWWVCLMDHVKDAKEWLAGVRRRKQDTKG